MHKTSILIAVLVAAAAVSSCRGWESDKPPVHLMWNMDTQEKGKAFRGSDFYKDGRSMRTPPAGTVAQGFAHEDEGRAYGRVDGRAITHIPDLNAASPEVALVRGQERYGIYCSPCHGLAGDGDGVVNGKLTVKAPSFHDQRLKDLPAGKIYEAIYKGVNKGNMGSYAAQLNEDDRWRVVAYVRALQKQRDASVTLGGQAEVVVSDDAPPEEKGKGLYSSIGCNACHTLDGGKSTGPTWQGIYGRTTKFVGGGEQVIDDAYLIESIRTPTAKVVMDFGPVSTMPPYDHETLSDADIANLIAFMKTLK